MRAILCTAVSKGVIDSLKKYNFVAGLDILFIGSACATLNVKSVGLNKGKDLISRSGTFRQILLRISGQQMWPFNIFYPLNYVSAKFHIFFNFPVTEFINFFFYIRKLNSKKLNSKK